MARGKRVYRSRTRILLSRGFSVALLLVFLFTKAPGLLQFPQVIALGLTGLLLACLSAFGRVWSSMYIGGRKTSRLVDKGPYSVTRNPLYIFSLLGAAGLGLASCNPLVLLCLLAGFLLYYPGVISREEEKLRAKHGAAFEEYMARVPRILPRISLFEQPEEISARPEAVTKAFGDAVSFVVAYIVLRSVVWIHAFNILPALKIPFF